VHVRGATRIAMAIARVLIVALIGVCLCVAQEVSSPESQDTTLWSQMAQQQQQLTAPVQPTTAVQDNAIDSNSNTDTTDVATDPDTQGPLAAEVVLPAGPGLLPMGGVGVMGLSQTESEGLKAHNIYRARHYAAALTWDSTLASKAQSWVDKCNYKYDATTTYGDNYWAGASTSSVNAILTAVESW